MHIDTKPLHQLTLIVYNIYLLNSLSAIYYTYLVTGPWLEYQLSVVFYAAVI